MEDVFTSNLEEAAQTMHNLGRTCVFFWAYRSACQLLVEYLSNLRKGNFMKTLSYEVGRSRAVLMAALGMMVSWVLISWVVNNWVYSHNFLDVKSIVDRIRGGSDPLYPAVIFCGLMLGSRRAPGAELSCGSGYGRSWGASLATWFNYNRQYDHFWYYFEDYVFTFKGNQPDQFTHRACCHDYLWLFQRCWVGLRYWWLEILFEFALVYLVANAVGLLAVYFHFSSRTLPIRCHWALMEHPILYMVSRGH